MPLSTMVVQHLLKLGEYSLGAYRQYSMKFTSSEMPLPILLDFLDPRPPTVCIGILKKKCNFSNMISKM